MAGSLLIFFEVSCFPIVVRFFLVFDVFEVVDTLRNDPGGWRCFLGPLPSNRDNTEGFLGMPSN